MSNYSNITEQDLENLRILAEQQKNERAQKIKNRILKQTHYVKLAENLSPITKKLDTINESTKEIGYFVLFESVTITIFVRLMNSVESQFRLLFYYFSIIIFFDKFFLKRFLTFSIVFP